MFSRSTNWNLTPNALTQALNEKRAEGAQLLDLTVSNPTECNFTYDRDAILSALAQPDALAYQPNPRGLESARRVVAAYHAARNIELPISHIFLTASTSEAYSYLFRLLCDAKTGDEILIPSPGYPLFDFLADIHNVKLTRYPCLYDHGWQIDFPALQKLISPRTRAIVIVNPNNPTGHYFRAHQLRELHELCAGYDLAILSDEVFLDFPCQSDDRAAHSFASNHKELTFTLSGISKICGLPQMKLSWVAVTGPEDLRDQAIARLEALADVYLSVSTPIQLALPQFLDLRSAFQNQVAERVRANLAELDRQLATTRNSPITRLKVEAGWNVVLRIPATSSSEQSHDEQFAIDLLRRENVLIHPGHFYDFSTDSYAVLSLIVPEEIFTEGISRLLRFASA
jgi:aspartate/methionine/tyrosine aminotransferase